MISPEDAYILKRCVKYPEIVAKYGKDNIKALIINVLVETPFKPEGAVTGYRYYEHEQVKIDDNRYDVYIYVRKSEQQANILGWSMVLGVIGLTIYLFRVRK